MSTQYSLFKTTLLIPYTQDHAIQFPSLIKLVRKFLATPASSVYLERLFWIQKDLWRGMSKATASNRRNFCSSSQFEAFGLRLKVLDQSFRFQCTTTKTNNLRFDIATLTWRSLRNYWLIYCAIAINNLISILAFVSVALYVNFVNIIIITFCALWH